MFLDKRLLDDLLKKAAESSRLRVNYDLRNSSADTSQRMLNALAVGTDVPIHQHVNTAETVICLRGRLEEIIYEELEEFVPDSTSYIVDMTRKKSFKEVARYLLAPTEGKYGMQIPAGVWHTVCVIEPSVIFEAKDGAYVG